MVWIKKKKVFHISFYLVIPVLILLVLQSFIESYENTGIAKTWISNLENCVRHFPSALSKFFWVWLLFVKPTFLRQMRFMRLWCALSGPFWPVCSFQPPEEFLKIHLIFFKISCVLWKFSAVCQLREKTLNVFQWSKVFNVDFNHHFSSS